MRAPTSRRGAAHDLRSSPLLCRAAPADGAAEPAGIMVAPAGDAAAAAADRIPADTAVVRHRAEGRDAVAHAMVAHRPQACGRGTADSRGRRTDPEPAR